MKIPFATGGEECDCKGTGHRDAIVEGCYVGEGAAMGPLEVRVDCHCVVYKEAKVIIREYDSEGEYESTVHEGYIEPDD